MANDKPREYLTSSELARLAGVSSDTLRHYERKRVLPAPKRGINGYRHYSPAAVERVRLIRSALAVGFSLDELAEILAVRDKGGAPCHTVRATALEKLKHVEAQLKDLVALRKDLREILASWDKLLRQSEPDKPVRLLERLGARELHQRNPRSGRTTLPNNRRYRK